MGILNGHVKWEGEWTWSVNEGFSIAMFDYWRPSNNKENDENPLDMGLPYFQTNNPVRLVGFQIGSLNSSQWISKNSWCIYFFSSVGLANHVQWNPYGDKWVNYRQTIDRNDQWYQSLQPIAQISEPLSMLSPIENLATKKLYPILQ